jgi:uncharacterized protein YjiS (DUF1127 family)
VGERQHAARLPLIRIPKENEMSTLMQKWRVSRRYRSTRRQIRALPADELRALGIPPAQIDRLACAVARSYR